MFFQIFGAIAIAGFLGYLSWQIQRASTRMEDLSDSMKADMGKQSDSLNARMHDIERDVGAIRNQLGDVQGQMGEMKGHIVVVNQRLDENEKAHAAFAESIDEIAAFVKGL